MEREPVRLTNVLDSWVQFNLKEGRKFVLNAYTLQHGYSKPVDGMRNWVIEGSNNGTDWEMIRNHVNDTSIGNLPYDSHTWQVNASRAFTSFRIRQTWKNAGNKHELCFSTIHFYGILHTLF